MNESRLLVCYKLSFQQNLEHGIESIKQWKTVGKCKTVASYSLSIRELPSNQQ